MWLKARGNFKYIFFFGLLSSLIVYLWFRSGLIYGGAEIGIFGYNPERFLQVQQFIWWGDVAPGMLVPQFIVGVPTYFILSLLQPFFSTLILQIIISFILLFSMGYGMYRLSLFILGQDKEKYAALAGFFYMLNSYTMVEVWHRFLYTGFFLAAFLPTLAYFWRMWIKKGKFVFLSLFLLCNLVFSYMFANLTSVIVIWIICFLFTLCEVFLPWQGRRLLLKEGYKFILGFFLFLLTNLWWLIPVFTVSTQVLPQQHSAEDSIATLISISRQTVLPFILQFANPYYLFYTKELGSEYTSFFYLILAWIPAIVIFIGLLISLRKKSLEGLGLLYIFSVIIAKGASTPFVYPYIWGFLNIFFIGVIRNPFEKLGILMSLFGSLLFVLGIEFLVKVRKNKPGDYFFKMLVVLILISSLLYALPIFTGKVFYKPDYPLQVKVPEDYILANSWFKNQKDLQGNILHLPFPDKDVVTYSWANGYHGVEINEVLFTELPSITRTVGIKKVDNFLQTLSYIFNKKSAENPQQILNVLNNLNVSYIILHKDTKFDDTATYGKYSKLYNPFEIEDTIKTLLYFDESATFGNLVIYKLKSNYYQPKITFTDSAQIIYTGNSEALDLINLLDQDSVLISPEKIDDKVNNKISIFPEQVSYELSNPNTSFDKMLRQQELNANTTFPFKDLLVLKQIFQSTGEILSEEKVNDIILANKLIVEINRYETGGDLSNLSKRLNEYDRAINNIFSKGFSDLRISRESTYILSRIFSLHLYTLNKLLPQTDITKGTNLNQTVNELINYLDKNNILSKYYIQNETINKQFLTRVQRFNVPLRSSYELMLSNPEKLVFYPDVSTKLSVKVDGKSIPIKFSEKIGSVSLGFVDLEDGEHQISYEVLPSVNLLPDLEKLNFQGSGRKIENNVISLLADNRSGSAFTTHLSNLSGGDRLWVNFEVLAQNPLTHYLQFAEDMQENKDINNCSLVSCYPVDVWSDNKDWNKLDEMIMPFNFLSKSADFQFLLPVVNDTSNFSSTLQVRNLNIQRVMDNNLFLVKSVPGSQNPPTQSEVTEFKKKNPTEYSGKLNLKKPGYVFFKETFNPGWELKLEKDNKNYVIDKHYLGNFYGNVYFVDKIGEYNFKLEFKPQQTVYYGVMMSLLGWLVILGILIYVDLWRKRK